MSGQHHDPVQDNIDTHPVKLAIGIAIGTVALIIGIVLTVQLAVGFYGSRSMKGDPAMSDAAVVKRIAPVAKLAMDPNAPAPAAAPAPIAAAPASTQVAAKAQPAAHAGKATYDTTCSVCHAAGLAGAPKAGDKAAWSARLKAAKGKAGLYASSLKGKGAMPAKGGNASLSDDAVKAAVDYLLATAK
jgi:cytochrome c5